MAARQLEIPGSPLFERRFHQARVMPAPVLSCASVRDRAGPSYTPLEEAFFVQHLLARRNDFVLTSEPRGRLRARPAGPGCDTSGAERRGSRTEPSRTWAPELAWKCPPAWSVRIKSFLHRSIYWDETGEPQTRTVEGL